jgi:hypothetical protein
MSIEREQHDLCSSRALRSIVSLPVDNSQMNFHWKTTMKQLSSERAVGNVASMRWNDGELDSHVRVESRFAANVSTLIGLDVRLQSNTTLARRFSLPACYRQ